MLTRFTLRILSPIAVIGVGENVILLEIGWNLIKGGIGPPVAASDSYIKINGPLYPELNWFG